LESIALRAVCLIWASSARPLVEFVSWRS
jgi:hypothetical protein